MPVLPVASSGMTPCYRRCTTRGARGTLLRTSGVRGRVLRRDRRGWRRHGYGHRARAGRTRTRDAAARTFHFGHANGSSGGPTGSSGSRTTPRLCPDGGGSASGLGRAPRRRARRCCASPEVSTSGPAALRVAEVVESVGAPVVRLRPGGVHERWPDLHLPAAMPTSCCRSRAVVCCATRTVQVQARIADGRRRDVLERDRRRLDHPTADGAES